MLLDAGICTIYKIRNTAPAGNVPNETLSQIAQHWFGELSFESSPIQYTESLEQVEVVRRIRILQNRTIEEKAIVVIGTDQYEVTRVFHGVEARRSYDRSEPEGSGEMITDLSLSRVVSAYDIG